MLFLYNLRFLRINFSLLVSKIRLLRDSYLSISGNQKKKKTERRIYALQRWKQKNLSLETSFNCPNKHLCFLPGKLHPTLLRGDRGWLRGICRYSPPFATIRHYSRLWRTVRFHDYSLSAIRVFQTPAFLGVWWLRALSPMWERELACKLLGNLNWKIMNQCNIDFNYLE